MITDSNVTIIKDDMHMFIVNGRMLALGNKDEIEHIALQYFPIYTKIYEDAWIRMQQMYQKKTTNNGQ